MKYKSKFILWVMILSLILLTLSGCGSSTTGNQEQKAGQETKSNGGTNNKDTEQSPYPEKPITFIIPYDAGGGSDVTGRLLATLMEQELGVKVNPVNKPGGSGVKGLAELAKADADGYTVMIITSSLSALKPMGRSEYSSEDFETIATAQSEAYALAVSPDSKYQSFDDLVNAVKGGANINVGTTAVGGNNYMAAAVVAKTVGVKFNLIPFSGGAAGAVVDLASGTLDAAYASPSEFKAQRDAGKVRLLAVTSENRSESLSDVPTFKELGYDVSFETVRVLLAPKGTPADRIEKLQNAVKKATENEKFIDFMKNAGSEVRFVDAKGTREFLKAQDQIYSELINELGLNKK